ncbi:MBL fold metallo-hydrolase [Hyphomicrobium sp.]|uniref:MBL fold metallo-hydrolase n=1 Tax=Hyphomicrobium sp. TaxID=82 RepID=UPI0025C4B33E|nr:MBL fold metallo-hydrolase [Hyphomicrobium sp.]MCC7253477.1 MBL fold metallo-hydrolase [Hyphomicrobium sp.]
MKLTIIGSSDAFGSGGRLQTCFHVAWSRGAFLIDCGATSLTGLFRQGFDPNDVSTIFVTHLHGDHFGGLVWWLIHAVHVSERRAPLTVVGPAGIEARFAAAAEALFPGSTQTERRFELRFRTWQDFQPLEEGGVTVTPFVVSHPSGATPYALRFEVDGRVLTFSGDTEWVETLVPAAQGADLFICECFAFACAARYHLNWRTIEANLPRLGAKHVLLTHLGPEALANRAAIAHPAVSIAEDGLVREI